MQVSIPHPNPATHLFRSTVMMSLKTVSILLALVATLAVAPRPAKGYTGDLTYYGGDGSNGACSQSWVPSGYTTVAMNSDQYDNGGACGTCVYGCFTDDDGARSGSPSSNTHVVFRFPRVIEIALRSLSVSLWNLSLIHI